MRHYLPYLLKTIWQTAKRFINEKYTYRASALAFTTLLALVPFFLILFYLALWLPFFGNLIDLGKNYLLNNFVPSSADNVNLYLNSFISQARHLPTLSIAFLFISAILMFETIEETLNDVWHAPKRKHFYLSYIFYSAIILILPIFLGISVLISTYLLSFVFNNIILIWLTHLALGTFPIIINMMLFTMMFFFIPNKRINFKDAFYGGSLAAILLEVSKYSFVMYMTKFPSYTFIYGAFATIPIFLIWLYLFWSIILFCALFIADIK